MTTDEKLLALLKKISDKTLDGSLKWESTTSSNVFQAAFTKNTIKLSPQGQDYVLALLNENGVVIERFTDVTLGEKFPNDQVFSTMQKLYDAARRQALGVEAALDSLLDEL